MVEAYASLGRPFTTNLIVDSVIGLATSMKKFCPHSPLPRERAQVCSAHVEKHTSHLAAIDVCSYSTLCVLNSLFEQGHALRSIGCFNVHCYGVHSLPSLDAPSPSSSAKSISKLALLSSSFLATPLHESRIVHSGHVQTYSRFALYSLCSVPYTCIYTKVSSLLAFMHL